MGSGALTLNQAILIAAIFEFLGAMILGRVSTKTIAAGIADIKEFKTQPFAYSYGMMWTLLVGGAWQGWASAKGLNVSATHSIIAGIIGFALAFNGEHGVLWITQDPASIPPYKGVIPIVLAWFFAPLATAFCASSIFLITRTIVLRNENSYERSFYTLPIFVVICTWINVYFVFVKGAKKTIGEGNDWDDNKAAWVAAIIAAGFGLVAIALIPWVRRRAVWLDERHQLRQVAYDNYQKSIQTQEATGLDGIELTEKPDVADVTEGSAGDLSTKKGMMASIQQNSIVKNVRDFFNFNGLDLGKPEEKDANGNLVVSKEWINDFEPHVQALQDRAEVFDSKTERVFGVLQVFSAICVMFAHGAGEVGYMAGPLATIWAVNQTRALPKEVNAPIWVLLIAAFSLVAGLATYGKTMTKAVGTEMCKITPARGFAAELSTAIVIMTASQYGLPTSSSQCITGGIVGIGMCEGSAGVNWVFFFQTFSSWVVTMFVMGVGVGLLFTQGHTAP